MNELKIEYLDIDEIIPYENNPRKNDKAVDKVAESIKQFGFQQPIVVDKHNVVIVGHTRLRASKQLGLKRVPVAIASDLTEEQVKAYRLADNKTNELATWDFEMLDEELADIETIDMSDFGFEKLDIDWDSVEDLTEETYDEPEKEMLECPNCHHRDSKTHFKKVE